eukprot:366119-Chlamydomonas_euryale.AAC.6
MQCAAAALTIATAAADSHSCGPPFACSWPLAPTYSATAAARIADGSSPVAMGTNAVELPNNGLACIIALAVWTRASSSTSACRSELLSEDAPAVTATVALSSALDRRDTLACKEISTWALRHLCSVVAAPRIKKCRQSANMWPSLPSMSWV